MGVVGREKRKKLTNGFLASFAKKGRQLDLGQEQGGSFRVCFPNFACIHCIQYVIF